MRILCSLQQVTHSNQRGVVSSNEVDRIRICSNLESNESMQTATHAFFAFALTFLTQFAPFTSAVTVSAHRFSPSSIMTLSERMTPMRALIILLALPSALGYATSAPMTKPAFMPQIVPSKKTRSPQKYDLGLGKNAPLSNHDRATLPPQGVTTAAQYWMAPEPAVTFPSPLAQLQQSRTSGASKLQPAVSNNKSKRTSILLHQERHSEDVLKISDDGIMSPSRPSASKLDLNTVWVEMLIHNQQMQLAHAS